MLRLIYLIDLEGGPYQSGKVFQNEPWEVGRRSKP